MEAFESLSSFKEKKVELRSTDKYMNLPRAVKAWVGSWPSQPSGTDWLRASGMYFTCPREFVLNYWNPRPNSTFTYEAYMMMSMGTHLHDYMQNYLLGPMGVMYGNWERVSAEGYVMEIKEGFHPDPDLAVYEIQHQKPLTWRYEEYRVADKHYHISGHLDGIIDCNKIQWVYENAKMFNFAPKKYCKQLHSINGELGHWELKTSGGYAFERVIDGSSLPDYYKNQANVYQTLKKLPRTVFWYVQRGDLDSKCVNYEREEKWWTESKRKANIIWRSIKNETLPESMMACKTPKDKRAKECVYAKECFGRRFDFAAYVQKAKESQPDRKWLDLSEWDEEDESTEIK